jgi:hypothetical protein
MCLDPPPPQVLRIDRTHSAPREPGADARPGPRRGYKRPRALSDAAVFRSWSRTETVPGGRRSLCPSATLVASRRVAYGPMSFSPSARWMTTYQCLHTVPLDLGSVDPWHPVYAHDPASDPPPPQVLRIDRQHRRTAHVSGAAASPPRPAGACYGCGRPGPYPWKRIERGSLERGRPPEGGDRSCPGCATSA